MSKSLIRITFLLMFFGVLHTSAQSSKKVTYKSVKYNENVNVPLSISEKEMIEEVYKGWAAKEILDNPLRLKQIKHLLRNRIRIIKIDIKAKQKSCQLLSEIELFNHYNKDLKRDELFNKDKFNPLKYDFNFYSSIPVMYRVDGTNYYIQIMSQFQ
ncbi:hypothetical protein [Winogradskyella flava]|uniref:hypothetical protein n=1 Tax=Winogradskyella flava TaxID=1884876 RepID=UPI0024913A9B|nr:hypothetical protein [Winogradskyella flava]